MNMGKFLIADDAFYVRKHLKNILKNKGYELFEEALNGSEAVDKYKKFSPDIVFMDIVMPVEDGICAVKDILEYDNKANIIILTALAQKSIIIEAIEAGAKNYIIKPFTSEQVFQAIEEIAYAKEISALD